jgi:hypothetical protein
MKAAVASCETKMRASAKQLRDMHERAVRTLRGEVYKKVVADVAWALADAVDTYVHVNVTLRLYEL